MKKTHLIITILTLSLLVSACGDGQSQTTTTVSETTTVTTEKQTTASTAATTESATAEETTTVAETTATSASSNTADGSLNDMNLNAIADALIANIADMPMTENMEITADLYPNYLFVDYVEGSEALASEALMSSVAHSAVLLRLAEGSDVEKVRSEIEANADPAKWICVGAEKTAVVSNGNLILLVMSFEEITDTMVDRFTNMK